MGNKTNSYLLKSEDIGEKNKVIGRKVVVETRVRRASLADVISPQKPVYETVNRPGVVVGGTINTYRHVTPSCWGWFSPHVGDSVVKVYAVKTLDGSIRMVAEEDTVFVYDNDVWLSDSKPSEEKTKAAATKKSTAKARKVKVLAKK